MYEEYRNVTKKAIEEYKKRIFKIYFKIISILITSQLIVSFVFFDIKNKTEQFIELKNHEYFMIFLFCLFTFAVLFAFILVNIGYFRPKSNIFKCITTQNEKDNLNLISKDYNLKDFDKLFLYLEKEVEKEHTTDETIKMNSIIKDTFYLTILKNKELKEFKPKSDFIKIIKKE